MQLKVRDVMTRGAVSVNPDDSLKVVVEKFFYYQFDGLPVVDAKQNILGIITQYDLVTKSSGLHLPTITKIFEDLPMLKKDSGAIKKSFADIQKLTVRDIMNTEPLTVAPEETVAAAARIFAEHHRVNPLLVVDKDHKLVGIVSRYDILKLFDAAYMGLAVQSVKAEAARTGNQAVEKETAELLGVMKKDFTLVSKWRSRFWYIVAILFFIAGFVVALAWVVRVTLQGGGR